MSDKNALTEATLYKDKVFAIDNWQAISDEEALPDAGYGLISLTRFQAEREALLVRNVPLGLVIEPGEAVEDVADDLDRFSVIALHFPAFSDGRNYSSARLLRERYGYEGEVRAFGDLILDQLPLMQRCGIDAFDVQNPHTKAGLLRGEWPDVTAYTQPVGSDVRAKGTTRPWLRRAG